MDVALTLAASPPPAVASSISSLRERYLTAQLAGDRRQALRLIEQAVQEGHPVETLQVEVVREAQREIGRLWQSNRISIAQEHMATAISQVVLSRLFEVAPQAERLERRVLVACIEGELHDFPARLIADFLELAGFDVHYLGANVPTDDLLKMLQAEPPDLLALSVTMSFNVPALRHAVERIRGAAGARLPILVGGHALQWSPGLCKELALTACDSDPGRVAEEARRLIGAARR